MAGGGMARNEPADRVCRAGMRMRLYMRVGDSGSVSVAVTGADRVFGIAGGIAGTGTDHSGL